MERFLANIELWLSGVGLLVILFVPSVLLGWAGPFWQVMALTATVVGIVHAAIFWLVRRRQRTIRSQAIADIRRMLTDVVNNQLTVILGNLCEDKASAQRAPLEDVATAVHRISTLVATLSEESLRSWRARYMAAPSGLAHERGAI